MSRKSIVCIKCKTKFKIPFAWVLGLEIVLRCPSCKTKYSTGYKMGAFMLAISLTLALVIANIFIYITSSVLIPLIAILILPLWIYIGYKLRLAWLRYKIVSTED